VAAFLWYSFLVSVEWRKSAAKHGISRDDALWAMTHAEVTAELEGRPGESVVLYIGHPHAQTDRYLEVIAAHQPPRTIVIFHVMELSDLYRHLLNEGNSND
jgi:hypothetical protein